jgi:hypothetical protein
MVVGWTQFCELLTCIIYNILYYRDITNKIEHDAFDPIGVKNVESPQPGHYKSGERINTLLGLSSCLDERSNV